MATSCNRIWTKWYLSPNPIPVPVNDDDNIDHFMKAAIAEFGLNNIQRGNVAVHAVDHETIKSNMPVKNFISGNSYDNPLFLSMKEEEAAKKQDPTPTNNQIEQFLQKIEDLRLQREEDAQKIEDRFEFLETRQEVLQKTIPAVTLPHFTFTFDDKCTGSDRKIVQSFWSNKVIPEMNLKLEEEKAVVRFFDSHKKATIGTLKPDILMITAGGSVNISNIVAVGELKSSGDFSGASKGQLYQYLLELLKLQPYRDVVYGFLTNNIDLLLVTVFRKDKAIFLEENLQENFRDGSALKCLWHLATSSLADLMFNKSVSPNIKLKQFLGRGHSSIVYSGIYEAQEVVVKMCNSRVYVHREKDILEKLQDIENVPKVVKDFDKMLLLKPVANEFFLENLRSQHIKQLVEVLRLAHLMNIVHRDVRAPNLFITDKGTALLNDWGSACNSGTSPSFEGGLVESSNYILNSLIQNSNRPVRPRDDLHSLARSVFIITRRARLPFISRPHTNKQLKKVMAYWGDVASPWCKIFEMAEKMENCEEQEYREFADALSFLL